jgi:hypothetical protein
MKIKKRKNKMTDLKKLIGKELTIEISGEHKIRILDLKKQKNKNNKFELGELIDKESRKQLINACKKSYIGCGEPVYIKVNDITDKYLKDINSLYYWKYNNIEHIDIIEHSDMRKYSFCSSVRGFDNNYKIKSIGLPGDGKFIKEKQQEKLKNLYN